MKSSPDKSDETPTPPELSAVILLLKDIGDVTWRMFVPLLLGIGAGLLFDQRVGSSPWGVVGGIALGLVITVILMRNVYKKL